MNEECLGIDEPRNDGQKRYHESSRRNGIGYIVASFEMSKRKQKLVPALIAMTKTPILNHPESEKWQFKNNIYSLIDRCCFKGSEILFKNTNIFMHQFGKQFGNTFKSRFQPFNTCQLFLATGTKSGSL